MTGYDSPMLTLKEQDAILEELWAGLEDIPVNPDTEKLELFYYIWPAGTDKKDVWRWFNERYSKGVSYLLYGIPFWEKDTDTLYEYVKKEIPYRLEENFGLYDLSEELVQECIDEFWNDTDIISLMNDRMDEHIRQVLDDHGIEYED